MSAHYVLIEFIKQVDVIQKESSSAKPLTFLFQMGL